MFKFSVNIQDVANILNRKVLEIENRVKREVQALSLAAHAHILNLARERLEGWNYSNFVGKDGKNIRWYQQSDNIWIVEIDESVMWQETGRPKMFMDWLLKPGDKGVKVAKDGSLYRSIPMMQQRGKGGKKISSDPIIAGEIKSALKENKLSLNKIELNPDGSPMLGVLHKLDMHPPTDQPSFPDIFSKPRTKEMAHLTGLPEHQGIYKLQGLAITQRMTDKGTVAREAVTFRTISSKHKAEGRWMAPEVKGQNFLKDTKNWADQQWNEILQNLQNEFSR